MTITADNTWQTILAIAAAITVLIGAGSAVFKLFNPYRQIIKRLDELERRIEQHGELFKKDLRRFEANEEIDTMVLEALFTLVEHARTNNSTGLMEATSKKMQAFLINRK